MALSKIDGTNMLTGKGKILQVTQNTNTSDSHSVSGNTYTDITFNSVVFEAEI